MDAKSVVTNPSPQAPLKHKGRNVLSGLAWSGRGTSERVDVSMDGGRNWQTARIDGPVFDKSVVRFYVGFRLERTGADDPVPRHRTRPATCSRRKDDLRKVRGVNSIYHNNGIPEPGWCVRARRLKMSKSASALTLVLAGMSARRHEVRQPQAGAANGGHASGGAKTLREARAAARAATAVAKSRHMGHRCAAGRARSSGRQGTP